jgi:hypothetical protein
VCTLFDNSSPRESTDSSPAKADATPKKGNDTGVSLHEGSMTRYVDTETLFQKPASQESGGCGQQRSMTDELKSLSSWTEKKDKQWKEDLVYYVEEQYLSYLPLAIVGAYTVCSC